ncbi:hypothetical protein [Methanobacterium ferruginis]|nr:hypothetical protein [Methanobacterium ferruginis]
MGRCKSTPSGIFLAAGDRVDPNYFSIGYQDYFSHAPLDNSLDYFCI